MSEVEEPNSSTSNQHETKFELLPSQRGGKILMLNGYRYTVRRINSNGHKVWRCVNRKICAATLVTNNASIIKEENHKCEQSDLNNKIKSKISKCIQRAEKETTPIPTIYAEAVEEFYNAGFDLISKVPKYKNIKKTLYKHRNIALQTNKTRFLKLKQVIVPGKFETFLFANYSYKKSRILLFATSEGKEILKQGKHIFCDGTFKSSSPPFLQLYCIQVDMGSSVETNSIIPVCYALLPDKKKSTYTTMFELIKSQIPEFAPQTFTTDYEVSAMAAISSVFPEAKLQGCFFHFSRALWRKAETLGIKKGKMMRSHIKRCIALAFLPKDYVADGWLYVRGECAKTDCLVKFNDYFSRTWIDNNAYFSDKWCFYNIKHRTNNANESWNARLNKKVTSKPNLANLLSKLAQDSSYYFGLFKIHGYISQKKKDTIWTHERIQNNIRELTDGEITLGHCIEKLVNC